MYQYSYQYAAHMYITTNTQVCKLGYQYAAHMYITTNTQVCKLGYQDRRSTRVYHNLKLIHRLY